MIAPFIFPLLSRFKRFSEMTELIQTQQPCACSGTKVKSAATGLLRLKKTIDRLFLKALHEHLVQNICQQLLAETTDLAQTHQARLFSDVEAAPAETGLRRLKSVIDTLLLDALHESAQHDADQSLLSRRIAVARRQLEEQDCLTSAMWCRLAACAIYENQPEKAGEITDRLLMQGVRSFDLYLVAGLAHVFDRRFQEARDMLLLAAHLKGNAYLGTVLSALDAVVQEQAAQTPYHANKAAKRSYVLADQHNGLFERQLMDALSHLQSDEEVIVVQDRMNGYDFRDRYSDLICSVETEHRVWQRYEGQNRNIRVVLKNDNHGIQIKSLKIGVRKALGSGAQEVLTKLNGSWSNDIAELVRQVDRRTDQHSKIKAVRCLDAYIPTKRVALFGVTRDAGHGVPVVMLNIARGLSGGAFTYSYISNHFDSNRIEYFDESGLAGEFANRAAFIKFARKHGILFDVLHFHSWHYADHYKPFHSGRDKVGIHAWIEQLKAPQAKVVYTDHANPTEDLRRIQTHHDVDYAALSDEAKAAFLAAHNLWNFSIEHWQRGWEATSILSRRQMMQMADYVTHVSATQKMEEAQFILPQYKVNGKHLVVWNGTDMLSYHKLPHVQEQAAQLKQERSGKSVLYVGRAEKEKGIFDLAEAAARLRRLDAPINLIYAGNFSPSLRAEIDQLAEQENLYTGVIQDRAQLAAQYLAADLIAQPTWGECFNQVVAEGLAMGTPSVVSNVSGPQEVYVNNGIAFGHQPQSPSSLAEEIKRGIAADSPLRQEIIAKGMQFVEQHLSVDKMVAQYTDIYLDGTTQHP